MSFCERYICRLDPIHFKLVAILMIVSCTGTVIAGVLPLDEIQRTVEVAGRWDVVTLFASVAIASTAFAAWMFWSLTKILTAHASAHLKTAIAIECLNTSIQIVDCIKQKKKGAK
jgi:hypothetical protein